MLRLEPFRFSDVLCDRFVVARRNPLLNAVSREIGPVGRFRPSFEWDHRKRVNFPMTAQSRVARTCSNSLDGHVTRLGERRVNRLPDVFVLLDNLKEGIDSFEKIDVTVHLAKERLIESEFTRKNQSKEALSDLLKGLRHRPCHRYQFDHDHLPLDRGVVRLKGFKAVDRFGQRRV